MNQTDDAVAGTEVVVTEPKDGIAVVRIDRPDVLNALNMKTRSMLADAFIELSGRADIRAIVMTGGPKVFAAGADVNEIATATPTEMLLRRTQRYWDPIAACPHPIVAGVNGFALGGGLELAMHADIIVVGENAKLGQPEIRIGVMPGAGGSQRLVAAVGKFRAFKLLLTGRPVSGAEAADMGLASEVVGDDQVQDRAMELARDLARMPPLAAQLIKEAVLAGQDAPLHVGLAFERRSFQVLFDTEDKREGITAFAEKRHPTFKGR